jgi:hypothetical protein
MVWVYKKKENNYWLILFFLLLLYTFALFSLIPVYPRYILLIVPFLYIFLGKLLLSFSQKWVQTLSVVGISFFAIAMSHSFIIPSTDIILRDFSYNISHGYFQDIYQEDIGNNMSLHMDRQSFHNLSQQVFSEAQIQNVTIYPKKIVNFKDSISIPVVFTYTTRSLGSFSENKSIHLFLQNGSWKIAWKWDLLFNGFSPGEKIGRKVIVGKRGSVVDQKDNILAEDVMGSLVSIKPSSIDTKQENYMLTFMSKISGVKAVHLQNAYLENPPKNTYIPLFSTFSQLNIDDLAHLKSFPGVQVSEYPSRIYLQGSDTSIANTGYKECCTRIYTSTNYHGVSGWEKQYDAKLSGNDGGSLFLEDTKGNIFRTIVTKKPKDGENIIVQL